MKARQFVNVVLKKYGTSGLYSLSRINPEKHLFYQSTTEAEAAQANKWNPWEKNLSPLPESSKLSFGFQPSSSDNKRLDFLPFYGRGSGSECKILCADVAGHSILYDTDSDTIETAPCLNGPKGDSPISFSIPCADATYPRRPDALYVMGRFPTSHNPCNFEVLIYSNPFGSRRSTGNKGWQWHPLPPPPYVNDPDNDSTIIQSYALLDCGSTICFSSLASSGVGAYCFHTSTGQWTKAGSWTLPLLGRAEHVPEIDNLWFGIAEDSPHHLCALDLSSLDSDGDPRLRHDWPDLDPPEGWVQMKGNLLYLGANRFCITKIFAIGDGDKDMAAVLTGVEMVPQGPYQPRMVKHKSLISDGVQCVL